MKQTFTVFEGIDGSGSSTQARIFTGNLFDASKSNHILLTREPFDSEEIRRRLREEKDSYANAELMAKLFFDDRRSHVNLLIRPRLTLGMPHIVSDRYSLSTIAYQSTQGLDMDELIKDHRFFPRPDITYFIDVAEEEAMRRIAKGKRQEEPKFEQIEFQKKLRVNYLEAIEKLTEQGEPIKVINGTPKIETVAKNVWDDFTRRFPQDS